MMPTALLSALILTLSVAAASEPSAFLCNPQSKPVAIAGGKSIPALATLPAADGIDASDGLWFVRRLKPGRFEARVPAPRRAYVVDRNRNGRPDFAGDRWVFGDEKQAATIVEMSDANADGRAEQIAFYLSGPFWLGERAKRAAERGPKPTSHPFPLVQALDPRWSPGVPSVVWSDKNGDGTWCRGSILEGGEVSCDWATLDREHEIWHGRMRHIRHYDLDGDGDIDIRAFAAADSVQRGANFDGSDQAPNPVQTCDLWAGTGYYRWPPIESEAWREQFGTFDMRKNTNTMLADLAAKYDLWMNMQDAPHAVVDLDGDGRRDAFLGASVSGGPTDVFERPGQPPAVWHSLERCFVGLAGPGQLNFNLDVNPYKRPRPDRNLSLAITTYRDRWGNELKNFVGAFAPPANWDGKALSPYNADGSAAPWTWLWDWHLTKPFRDLYVACWVKDWKHAGEGAAVDIRMQDYRVEADFDCSTDFTLYWSPIAGVFHLQGVEWGWWNMRSPSPKEIHARWGDLQAGYGLFTSNQFSYGAEALDTDLRRFYATRWACYFDRDADGLIDTYLIDADNDGLFDTRVWYDRPRGNLLWAEGNRFQQAARRLEFPAQSFALANYRRLRDFYQKMLRQQRPLVDADGRLNLDDAADARPVATVGLDFGHAGEKWSHTGRVGFSRLLTSISRRPVAVEPVAAPFTPHSLARLTHLVIVDLPGGNAWSPTELSALDAWLHRGGRLLLVLPETAGAATQLADRYGVAARSWETLGLTPSPIERFRGFGDRPLEYAVDKDGFCVDGSWALEPRAGAVAWLTYVTTDSKKKPRSVVLAAESPQDQGRVVVCGARSLLDNRYTAYKLPNTRPFDRRRFCNREFLEQLLQRYFE
jgi:hypothetical protein